MKRILILGATLGAMAAVVALAIQDQEGGVHPGLEWANRAKPGKATSAILLEFGVRDANVRDWSGKIGVSGATVLRREGYRFRETDKLVGDDGWQASSHRAIRGAKGNPVVAKIEPIASVGVVYQLQDVQSEAKLTIALAGGEKAEVKVADVLAGKAQQLFGGDALARLVSAAEPVAVGKTEDDFPAAAYGPDGTLWVAYVAYHVLEDARRIEPPPLKEQPADFKKYYTPRNPCQVFVRSWKDGKWNAPIAVTKPDQYTDRVAIATLEDGAFWVAYSRQRSLGNFDIFTKSGDRFGRLGPEVEITKTPGADLSPTMCTDANGAVWLAWQAWDPSSGQAYINSRMWTQGNWQQGMEIRQGGANLWNPVLAAGPAQQPGPSHEVALVYDAYGDGNYDVMAMVHLHTKMGGGGATTQAPFVIARSRKFEARPAAVYDKTGRLWIAYEEGPENWGKDYGALDSGAGRPLYNERSVRVACLVKGNFPIAVGVSKIKLFRPVAELPISKYDPPVLPFEAIKTANFERATRYAYPKIGIDGRGDVWVAYRQNFGTRYTTHPGPYWLNFVRRLEEDKWSEPVEVHHSDGLLDSRPVLLPHASGGLLVVHNTDGRCTTPEVIDNQIYAGVVNLPASEAAPKLVAHDPGTPPPCAQVKAEAQAVDLLRGHRLKAGMKSYQYLRGEYHRHTELSWDGAPDGSLEDMFRYAIDAAKMDWIGNGDHDNGAGREYSWWLTQKATSAYLTVGKFTPMYTYERSVAYPHGHRNVMFARAGIRTLPRLAPPPGEKAEGGVHPDDTKMLYRYLHELGGICAVHTSATGMGTDWRDNDPAVEPIVEIYQGDRMSYEHEGAPRAGYDPKTDKQPGNVAGWFPKGFINLALQKGYKLGFQASSDHWSTHISYFIVLAERNERQAILDAVRRRHCYGATDNILLDFRHGPWIMGDEVPSPVAAAPTFTITARGTAPLAKIDVLRDSEVVATLKPKKATAENDFAEEWTDAKAPAEGTHYYYVRVLQTDGEIAWGSPIWLTFKK
jgi:hypothetical protein